MNWARIVYLALIVAGYVISLAKNGESREPYNAGSSTIAFAISIVLLAAGGFFG